MNPPRDTGTGDDLEGMVIPALVRGGYQVKKRVTIGKRPGGGKHIVDLLVGDAAGKTCLISLKWQQSSGTAEQKVPFEVLSLAHAVDTSEGRYSKAYLILGGGGWKLRDFYVAGGLIPFMRNIGSVIIMTLEDFIPRANKGQL